MSSYGFNITVAGSVDQVITRVTDALKTEGFGVLTTINVKETLKNKIGADVPPYVILGACNPQFAHKALDAEPDIGLLLPCNVVVREEADGKMNVGFMDPYAVMKLTDNPAVHQVAKEVRAKLERVSGLLSK